MVPIQVVGMSRCGYRRLRRVVSCIAVAVCVVGLAVTVQAPPAGAATANPTPAAGSRRNATTLSFAISGTGQLSVDVGSGNALFTDRLITLPGVTSDVPIMLWYNSSVWGSSVASAVTGGTGSGVGCHGVR